MQPSNQAGPLAQPATHVTIINPSPSPHSPDPQLPPFVLLLAPPLTGRERSRALAPPLPYASPASSARPRRLPSPLPRRLLRLLCPVASFLKLLRPVSPPAPTPSFGCSRLQLRPRARAAMAATGASRPTPSLRPWMPRTRLPAPPHGARTRHQPLLRLHRAPSPAVTGSPRCSPDPVGPFLLQRSSLHARGLCHLPVVRCVRP